MQLIDAAARGGLGAVRRRPPGPRRRPWLGRAVAQLGAVARQHGVPASLHGTGGAWMVVADDADPDRLARAVRHSLDRKVCNTLNVCCIVRGGADRLAPVVLAAPKRPRRRVARRWWYTPPPAPNRSPATARFAQSIDELGTEWEWEDDPELSVVVVDDVAAAVALFNRYSPRFAASLIGGSDDDQQRFYASVDAPFVGNGFTVGGRSVRLPPTRARALELAVGAAVRPGRRAVRRLGAHGADPRPRGGPRAAPLSRVPTPSCSCGWPARAPVEPHGTGPFVWSARSCAGGTTRTAIARMSAGAVATVRP
ncbi:MAG: hypothetical protein R2713_05280 [Ilumatobacteraceae bacterium]